ncbi:MAG: DUF3810 domain-containing protein [Bacteroidetes bacterium]|nr:MAG: DUF3810 domain-containing protein [Bacteroidota bacterium]
MQKRTKTIIALSILPQYLIVKLLSNYPDFIETYYSNGLYQFTSKVFRYVFGWLPFSVGDLLYTIAGIYIIRWFIINKKRIIKDTKAWLIDIFAAVSLVYFAFHLFWGMNYYRLPLHKTLQLENTYTTEELITVTKKLINKSNAIHRSITKNDSIKVEMPYSKKELLKKTTNGYDALAKIYPHLEYAPNSIKFSIYSLPLTYMGFSGYLNPFTNEAQIDGLIPLHKYPTTACHEKAHQIGYAAENESNFIGCLATIHNEDIYFNYSGYIFALRHCLNEIYKRDIEIYKILIEDVNKGILINYQESYDFWMSYQNPLEPLFKSTFNAFLKANNQEKGIKSYNYAVALFVNYFKDEL